MVGEEGRRGQKRSTEAQGQITCGEQVRRGAGVSQSARSSASASRANQNGVRQCARHHALWPLSVCTLRRGWCAPPPLLVRVRSVGRSSGGCAVSAPAVEASAGRPRHTTTHEARRECNCWPPLDCPESPSPHLRFRSTLVSLYVMRGAMGAQAGGAGRSWCASGRRWSARADALGTRRARQESKTRSADELRRSEDDEHTMHVYTRTIRNVHSSSSLLCSDIE